MFTHYDYILVVDVFETLDYKFSRDSSQVYFRSTENDSRLQSQSRAI